MFLFSRQSSDWRLVEFLLVTLCLISLFFSATAHAAQVQLAWDASTGPNLGGHNLHYGQASGNYSSTIDVGNKTSHTVSGLQDGKTYYFAVTAYDATGNLESGYSNQVSVTTPGAVAAPTANFNANPTSGNDPLIVTFSDTSNTNGNNLSWFWEFGDGGTSTAQTAVHTYQTPGTYTVKLTVTDSGGTNTKTRANYITVSATTSGGGGSGGSGSGSTGSRVTGRQVVLYTFEEGSGSKVRDVSGVGTPLDLTVSNPGRVSWLSGGGLAIDSPTVIKSVGAASKVKNALQASQALTIEAWVVPDNITQNGPARIVALSRNNSPNGGNFLMGQNRTKFVTRVRTTATDNYGKPLALVTSAETAAKGVLTHLVYTRDASGAARFYVNGLENATGKVGGNLSNWGDYVLALASEPEPDNKGGYRPWLGELHLVALYDRALTAAEVDSNFDAGLVLGSSGSGSGGGSVEVIVDNLDSNTSQTGTWKTSSGPNPYNVTSIYSDAAGTFTWAPALSTSGTYDVYAWWTYHSNRSTTVPYRIKHNGGTAKVIVDQRKSALAGQWYRLGTYTFTAGTNGQVTVSSENGQASADAVRLVKQ